MPSTDSLLQLRSNAPGLPGPYLQENLAPYELLDAMGKARPRSILAIGGRVKSQYLAREFSTTLDHHETPSVALTSLDHKTIWLDCELHSHQMPRIKAKSSIAGYSRLHFLNSTAARVAKIAYPIYTDVLALFSDITTLSCKNLFLAATVSALLRCGVCTGHFYLQQPLAPIWALTGTQSEELRELASPCVARARPKMASEPSY
ncbi:hypothetical protein BGZ61DRAFT_487712 [Ilyonectria robusta]|uniref:uncharacterized protein n=1 Tax=Ilyonectria robusta TaxID=1079257 RepID=UPI001E8D6A25|nr:uncharacterized protein BGZ61DRAFT_487712 [Ilyonectria robusta]KAH8650789.1 hypothetical protein BGZ61DRAFT_487712 [Ilyonectria robusta]